MEAVTEGTAMRQQLLVELAHLLGRALQYGPSHPACASLTGKTYATLTRTLDAEGQLAFGILKDNVMIGDVPASHPAVRARIASHLHDRGVLVLRFLPGVSRAELDAFLELLLFSPQYVYDHGGLLRMAGERGVSRIQVEELVHDLTDEELERGRRRHRLRDFFATALRHLLGGRALDEPVPERLAELLAFPEVTVAILEDQGAGLAEAAAGLALMIRQEEQRTGIALGPQLRDILASLAPMVRDRVVLGFPPLVGEFRAALTWAFAGYKEPELARFVFPAVRAHAHELDLVLYALSVLVPHDGTRLSALRFLGLMLHDLPLDDVLADEVLAAVSRPVEEYESYRRERQCLVEPAARALGARKLMSMAFGVEPEPSARARGGHTRGVIREIVRTAARTRQFERFCRRLPDAAEALAGEGARAAIMELVRALTEVQVPQHRELALRTAEIIASAQADEVLAELEAHARDAADAEVVEYVRMMVTHAPRPVLEHLDRGENEHLRKIILDLLPVAGPRIRPLLRGKLTADAPASVSELMALLPLVEGRSEDLVEVARNRDENVRLAVVRLLRALEQDERTMEIFVRYLADPSQQVRHTVRPLVVGELLSPNAIVGIGRLLDDVNQPDEVHHRLIGALGVSAHDAAAQLLWKIMQPEGLIESAAQTTRRELAADALHRCPAPAARRLFAQGLESTSRRVRKACERAARGDA